MDFDTFKTVVKLAHGDIIAVRDWDFALQNFDGIMTPAIKENDRFYECDKDYMYLQIAEYSANPTVRNAYFAVWDASEAETP